MTNNASTNMAFKDQMQEVIPVAEAEAIRESQLEAETLQRQLEEEQQAQQQAQLRLDPPGRTPADNPNTEQKSFVKRWIVVGAAVLFAALAAVGGICGSGNCSGSSGAPSPFTSVPTTTPLLTTETPTRFEKVPTRSPVTPPPTLRPIASRSNAILSFINSITLLGRNLSYPNTKLTAEEQALNWLIGDDVGTSESDEFKLRQRYALATLWFANGPLESPHNNTWLMPIDECDWESIDTCVGGEVTAVQLNEDGLFAQLPSDLALLTSLEMITMSGNELTGSIPTEFGLLTELTFLSLSINQLAGNIPTELNQLTALRRFFGYNNNLSGNMPFCDGTLGPTTFEFLIADCNEVSCPCCTACCPIGGFEGIPSGTISCDA